MNFQVNGRPIKAIKPMVFRSICSLRNQAGMRLIRKYSGRPEVNPVKIQISIRRVKICCQILGEVVCIYSVLYACLKNWRGKQRPVLYINIYSDRRFSDRHGGSIVILGSSPSMTAVVVFKFFHTILLLPLPCSTIALSVFSWEF